MKSSMLVGLVCLPLDATYSLSREVMETIEKSSREHTFEYETRNLFQSSTLLSKKVYDTKRRNMTRH